MLKKTAKAIVAKVKSQRPDTPEAKLMFAIFEQAVSDLFDPANHANAESYLKSEMPHLEAIGIDSDWVIGLFKKAELEEALKHIKPVE